MTITSGEDGGPAGLTPFQVEVAQLFFALPASKGFLLAGGAALLAQRLTARPTQDLDFFTHQGSGDVATARDSFEDAVRARGWAVERIQDGPTFCRLVVHGPEDLLVDLALDSPPGQPPTASFLGPRSLSPSWPAASFSPSSIGPKLATSPTSSRSPSDMASTCSSVLQPPSAPGSTIATSPTSSEPSTASRTPRSPSTLS